MSALPQAIAPNPHTNLLNVYILIANEMEFEQKKAKKKLLVKANRIRNKKISFWSPQ
jgi:hypothetical protein